MCVCNCAYLWVNCRTEHSRAQSWSCLLLSSRHSSLVVVIGQMLPRQSWIATVWLFLNLGPRHTFSLRPTLFPLLTLTSTLPAPSASEVTTIWRYTNVYIIIIITAGAEWVHVQVVCLHWTCVLTDDRSAVTVNDGVASDGPSRVRDNNGSGLSALDSHQVYDSSAGQLITVVSAAASTSQSHWRLWRTSLTAAAVSCVDWLSF